MLLVGFTEEVTFRGVLLVGLRTRFREVWVWLITTTAFAAAHLVNIVLGRAVAETVEQVFFAFLAGTVFYVFRRVTGSLIPAMILHALWDFANFANTVGTPSNAAEYRATSSRRCAWLAKASRLRKLPRWTARPMRQIAITERRHIAPKATGRLILARSLGFSNRKMSCCTERGSQAMHRLYRGAGNNRAQAERITC